MNPLRLVNMLVDPCLGPDPITTYSIRTVATTKKVNIIIYVFHTSRHQPASRYSYFMEPWYRRPWNSRDNDRSARAVYICYYTSTNKSAQLYAKKWPSQSVERWIHRRTRYLLYSTSFQDDRSSFCRRPRLVRRCSSKLLCRRSVETCKGRPSRYGVSQVPPS